jgi:KUP system potassium uptake protein
MTSINSASEAPDDPALGGYGHKPTQTKPSLFWGLALGSIGVVYGDIGTSPLYALREAVNAATGGGPITEPIIFGILSLIVWALILVVTLKYVLILLNADNRGEGGTLSLMALAQRSMGKNLVVIPVLGMIGAALFFGDAIITPAISVLSAVEGLEVYTATFKPYVMPITIAILIGLFAVQSSGTAAVARFFGPITLVWFAAIAAAGLIHIGDHPAVLQSFNPLHAVSFLSSHGQIGFVTLGAVFLAVTGAEALYADLGHFGKRPIQMAWLVVVLPALAINYLGQGAMLLNNPTAISNPFFLMIPEWALLPMVGLATAATIIASQAVITGAFSLTRQAMQLGLLPRMEVRFTSESHAGQFYMPQINWLLLLGVLILVVLFQSSTNLASAYGIAVTGTMVVTSAMAIFVMWKRWRWPLWAVLAVMLPLLAIDVLFFGANALKILHGGWVPLALGFALCFIMWSWRQGSRILFDKTRKEEVPLRTLVNSLERNLPPMVSGAAVFFTADPDSAPTAMLHSLKHYKVLHHQNIILTVRTSDQPVVSGSERVVTSELGKHFTAVKVTFGYMETPDVPRALKEVQIYGKKLEPMTTSYFLSRRRVTATRNSELSTFQEKLFILLARNADDASRYFRLPTNSVVEVGSQITI